MTVSGSKSPWTLDNIKGCNHDELKETSYTELYN